MIRTCTRRGRVALGLGAALAASAVVAVAIAAQPETKPAPTGPAAGGGGADMGEMLISGLKSTKGCLGVDAGQMMSGKNSIFAWFENKAAAMAWYHSPVHRRVMAMTGVNAADLGHEPMAHVPDDVPLMVIASITMAQDGEAIEGIPMPVSQISIEMFQALPGGAHVNGRLSPKEFEVKHMRDYTGAGAGAG